MLDPKTLDGPVCLWGTSALEKHGVTGWEW